MGMGGSSLAPEVFRTIFGKQNGWPELIVLDTTHPDWVQAARNKINPAKTLFIFASKSGGTVEPSSQFAYFYDQVKKAGIKQAGQNFVAITDADTGLQTLAKKHKFRHVFTNPSDIGGRFSALSFFGIVPAALMGIDVQKLLAIAKEAAEHFGPEAADKTNSAKALGAYMGACYVNHSKDKLTILAPKEWILQFGDLQMELRGKAALTAVPVVDAAAADQIPAEKDWNAIPAAYTLKGTLKAPVTVKILHDDQCIYVRFEQKTDTSKLVSKQNRDGQIWRDDSFQILLSPGNDNRSYHQFVVNPAGASQSYHQFFDQVADCYVRKNNLREKEWNVTVEKKADSWCAVFTIRKTFLDKHRKESIHGLQLFADNSASGGGKAFFRETDRIYHLSEAGVLRLLAKGQPASRPFPEKPALFFHQGKLLTGVPGDFEFRLACPAAKITGQGVKARDFYFLKDYAGSSGVQRFTIYNDRTGCIFAGRTEALHWHPELAYGSTVLVPEPKKMVWSKEKLPATGLTLFYPDTMEKAVPKRLADIWSGFLQEKLVCKTAQLSADTIVIGKNPVPAELPAVTRNEGYALAVSGNGITIRGTDSSGLIHGISTLEQLARYAMLRNEDFLPGVTVSDWPDMPNRYLQRWLDACYWLPRKDLRPYADSFDEIKAGMYDFAYRFCMLNKMNHLGLRNPSQVIYETPDGKKLNRSTSHLSWREMRDFAAFCRKYHLDIVPVMPSCSHANYLMTNNFPKMILKGY
ncbi:MAG: hypothetical protein IKO93_00575, partial [Lentisphaeria bacterium]|nr:hypothetical protein [Lentisphaeria bacterium]